MTDQEKQEYEQLKKKAINGDMSIQQALKYFQLKHKRKDEQRSN
jgi:hypothetical protein